MVVMRRFVQDSWRLRCAMAGLVAMAGGVAAGWSLLAFERQITVHLSAPGFVVLAMLGAGLAGLLLGPLFGRAGRRGAALSLAGFFAATVLGAYIAGLLGLKPHRLDLVATWLVFNLVTPLAAFWLLLWGAIHCLGRSLRRRFT